MAIQYVKDVGHQTGNNVDSDGGSFASLPAAGNSVIVPVAIWNRAGGTGDVTDNQSNTYTRDVQFGPTTSTATAQIYSDTDIGTPSGTFTITVNPGGAGDWFEWIGVEFSNLADSSAVDITASTAGTNATPAVTGATTNQANELWVGVLGVTDNNAADIGMDLPSGWTLLSTITNPSATIAFLAAYKVVSATGALAFDGGTLARTPNSGWAIAAVAYKEAAVAGGVLNPWKFQGAMGALIAQ